MPDRSDGGRALVPSILGEDAGAGAAGADVTGGTATAIAKAEPLQEREAQERLATHVQGEACYQEDAQGAGEEA